MAERPGESERSLFGEILDWMLAPLLFVWPLSIAFTHYFASNVANFPYDQALREHVAAIARQVKLVSGRPVLSLPASARALLRVEVEVAGAGMGLAHAVALARVEQDAFGQRGLARVDVGDDAEVAQLAVGFHEARKGRSGRGSPSQAQERARDAGREAQEPGFAEAWQAARPEGGRGRGTEPEGGARSRLTGVVT